MLLSQTVTMLFSQSVTLLLILLCFYSVSLSFSLSVTLLFSQSVTLLFSQSVTLLFSLSVTLLFSQSVTLFYLVHFEIGWDCRITIYAWMPLETIRYIIISSFQAVASPWNDCLPEKRYATSDQPLGWSCPVCQKIFTRNSS